MKVVLLNGSMETGAHSRGKAIAGFIKKQLKQRGYEVTIFNVSQSDIPLLHPSKLRNVPEEVIKMCDLLRNADIHFWLSPLYHGSIPGIMKNCLDWLETTSQFSPPYLTDKIIGMVCWANGVNAVNGIHTMTTIAHSLRAWTVPYNVPISIQHLFDENEENPISEFYKEKLNLLIDIAVTRNIEIRK